MRVRLPIPQYWQDFEALCHTLWRDIWGDPNAQMNGRRGQPQNGVDIFGIPHLTGFYAGVQCKDKDQRLGAQLTVAELRAEVEKALNFVPRIKAFCVATSAPRDAEIQAEARLLTLSAGVPLGVSVWSWDDIEAEILARPQVLARFYEETCIFLSLADQASLNIGPDTSRDQITAFFTRPAVRSRLSLVVAHRVIQVVQELADNAFRHGAATEVGLVFSGDRLAFWDNGVEFDCLSMLGGSAVRADGLVGGAVLGRFRTDFSESISLEYTREVALGQNSRNYTNFFFATSSAFSAACDTVDVILDAPLFNGRTSARRWAESIAIPPGTREIVLTVGKIALMSGFFSYITSIVARMPEDCVLRVSLPRGEAADWFGSIFSGGRVVFINR